MTERLQGDPPRALTVQLLNADQLAERWQVPQAQVYALTRAGAIPAVRLGRYYRYRLDAIERWERDGGRGVDAGVERT